jgi:anti-anti-sigma factor
MLRLVGELSLESIPQVEEPLDRVLEEGSGEIVMDLREVSFLDSSGVRLLLSAEARSAEADRAFAIILGEGQPARTLELMGLVDRPRRLAEHELG